MVAQVRKRDGTEESFDRTKIETAIERAFEAAGAQTLSNFVNSEMDTEDARSMCCRLRLDNRELESRGGGLFGSNPLTGSIAVVTINLAQLGYRAVDETDFFDRLRSLMDVARRSLETKREVLETGAVDYVALDLKTLPERYDELGADVGDAIERSVELVRSSGIDHEFRTTFDPGVVPADAFETLADLTGDSPLGVQSVETETVLCPDRVRETPPDPIATISDAADVCPSQLEYRG